MSFIWLLCKVCLAIEGYNIIVDYIVTKTVLNDIKKIMIFQLNLNIVSKIIFHSLSYLILLVYIQN